MKSDGIEKVVRLREGSNRGGRNRFSRKVLCYLVVVLVGIVTITGSVLYNIIYRKPNVNDILTKANLAKLPESIKDLIVDTRPLIVAKRSGKRQSLPNRLVLFIRFQTEPSVIDSYIASSPSIDEDFFLPLQRKYEDRDAAPTWWRPEQGRSIRLCDFPGQSGLPAGSILVDDENNTIRILVFYVVNPQYEGAVTALSRLKDQTVGLIGRMMN